MKMYIYSYIIINYNIVYARFLARFCMSINYNFNYNAEYILSDSGYNVLELPASTPPHVHAAEPSSSFFASSPCDSVAQRPRLPASPGVAPWRSALCLGCSSDPRHPEVL